MNESKQYPMPAAASWNLLIHNRCLFIRIPCWDGRGTSVASSTGLHCGQLDLGRIHEHEEDFA